VALEVGRQFALAINDERVHGMRQRPLIRPEVQAKPAAHRFYFSGRSSQKVPRIRVGLPGARVLRQNFRRIVNRIEADAQQHQIAAHFRCEALLKASEIVREAETKIGEPTTGVNESDSHHLASEPRETYALPGLVD